MSNFLRCLRGGETPSATIVDAKKAAAIVLDAEKAIGEKAAIENDANSDLV